MHQCARQPLNVLHDELLRTRKSLACERPDFLSLSSSCIRGGTVDCASAGRFGRKGEGVRGSGKQSCGSDSIETRAAL